MPSSNPYRDLPSVNHLVEQLQPDGYRHERLVEVCRQVLDDARLKIERFAETINPADLLREVQTRLSLESQLSLRPVINATGIIIHTNLGRAPLSESAMRAIQAVAAGYSTLEYDLSEGNRGHRDEHIEDLITAVTGAEAALVVNNNASAVYLVLSALAKDREIIISRGELVEIGGGFRIPDVMRESGALLVEVGTTNRTRPHDFLEAIGPNTIAIMRVHSSNFKVVGFTETTPLAELCAIAHQHELIVLDDLGSGALLDTAQFGLDHEPTIQESLAAGADLVMFSADKLLGGPQAGIIVGKRHLIDKLRHYPLTRALRPDKLCLAGLAATLHHYRDEDPLQTIPIWQMMAMTLEELEQRAKNWEAMLGGTVLPSLSAVGGGSLPGSTLPTMALALNVPNLDELAKKLRQGIIPVIGRIQQNCLWLDPRTVLPVQDDLLIRLVQQSLE